MDFYSLGILLIALRGLNTRTVRIAERFNFSTSRQYSRQLEKRSCIWYTYCSNIKNKKGKEQKLQKWTKTVKWYNFIQSSRLNFLIEYSSNNRNWREFKKMFLCSNQFSILIIFKVISIFNKKSSVISQIQSS